MSDQNKQKWYVELMAAANALGEELGLDDLGTKRLREFIYSKGREEFLAGNKSGIAWARKNPPKYQMNTEMSAAATA